MSLDSWNSIFQAFTIILLFFTFLVGAGAVFTSRKIATREKIRLVNAEQSIAEADRKAAEANQKAAEAAKGTAIAVADASAAKERTVKLELETVQQREKTAKAERELLELKERLKPRQLSETIRATLIDSLRRAVPKGLIKIDCVLGDGEGFAFANQIDATLKTAGWTTSGVNQGAYGEGGNPFGFGIVVNSLANAPQHAVSLQRAFKEAGLNIQGIEQANIPAGSVVLLIGNKPQ